MVVSFWSLKGGVGCSVAAAMFALSRASVDAQVTLIDLGGDLPAVLGTSSTADIGVSDWLDSDLPDSPGAFGRLGSEVAPGLRLVSRGTTTLGAEPPPASLTAQLDALPGTVVIDAGLVGGPHGPAPLPLGFVVGARRSILVTRNCYLALRRGSDLPVEPTGVLVLRERGRALRRVDVEAALRVPVLAEIAVDPAVARRVDAGLLASRPLRGLERTLASLA